MRRHAVVLGLASMPFAGCAAVRDRVSLARGCVDVPYHAPTGIAFYARSMTSRHVRATVAYDIAIADGVDPRTIDRVAYVLPGRGGPARNVFSDLNYGAPFADAISANAELRHAALVAVDAGETYFHPRTSGEDRLALVTEELPNAVAAFTGSRPKREALIGMSMGGYGALLAAERQPARYRAVAVAGPAIFPSYEDERGSVGDAFDSTVDYARYDVIAHAGALRGVPVRIRCGSRDPFLPGVRAFAKACPSADVQIDAGCHNDGFWRFSAPSLLQFVAHHL